MREGGAVGRDAILEEECDQCQTWRSVNSADGCEKASVVTCEGENVRKIWGGREGGVSVGLDGLMFGLAMSVRRESLCGVAS